MSGPLPVSHASYSHSIVQIASIAESLSTALNSSSRPPSPPHFDIHHINVRHLVDYVITNPDFYNTNGHVSDILSLILVPTAWPTRGLPALREVAGTAARNGVCGKVWRRDKLAYKCKTCERDSTCVVCVQCFRNGDHTGHDFAMIRTSGGCCDCGDAQAWRPEGFCCNHPGACPENEDPARDLHPVLRRNLVDIVQVVAERLLLLSLYTRRRRKSFNMKASIAHACDLLDWLLQVVQCGDGVRRVVGLCLANPAEWPAAVVTCAESSVNLSEVSWLRVMMEIDGVGRFSTHIQDALHKVYFQLITDLVFKKTFLAIFVDNYESYLYAQLERIWFQEQRNSRDEEHHPKTDIAENFSVQLFTVPALVPIMIRQGGLLDVIMRVLLNLFETNSAPVRPYDETIPYVQSAFANEYQSVLHQQRFQPTSCLASSSTTPKPRTQKQRYFLPMPFNTYGAHGDMGSTSDDANRPSRQDKSVQDMSRSFSEITEQPVTTSEQYPRSNYEWRYETETVSNPLLPSLADILTREFSEDENMEQTGVVEAEDRGIVVADPAEGLNGVVNESENIEDVTTDANEEVAQIVVADGSDSDSGAPVGPVHALDENGEVVMLTDNEEGLSEGTHEGVSVYAGIDEQFAVFRSGLRCLPLRSTGIPSLGVTKSFYFGAPADLDDPITQDLKQVGTEPASAPDALQSSVNEARRMEEAAILGTGPLAHTLRLEWSPRQRKMGESMIWKAMSDLKYVLTHRAVAFHLVHVRKDLFRKLVRMLSIAQGMNMTARKFGDHVFNETDTSTSTWTIEVEIVFCIELLSDAFCGLNLPSPLKKGTELFSHNRVDLAASRLQCIQIVRSCLDEWLDREESLEARSVYKDESFSISHGVSMHLPLHRFLAFMVHRVLREDQIDLETALSGEEGSMTVTEACRIARHPLRIFALLAQIRAGMWRRNGYSLVSQSRFYQNGMISDWLIDLDLFLVQCCAVVIGPDEFIREAQVSFRIYDLRACLEGFGQARSDRSPNKNVSSACSLGLLSLAPRKYIVKGLFEHPVIHDVGNTYAELTNFIPTLIEELFVLIARVASERGKCGFTESQALRRKLLHQLCCSDRTYSQLSKIFSVRISNELDPHDEADNWGKLNSMLQSIMADICLYVEPKGMQQGFYKLKDEVWQEFDPFEPHLSAEDRNTALIRYAAVRKGPQRAEFVIPLDDVSKRPVFFQLRDLRRIGKTVCTPAGLATLLLKTLLQNSGQEILDGALPAALHLVCLAVGGNAYQNSKQLGHCPDNLVSEGPQANAAFIVVCDLYKTPQNENPVLVEILPILERIIRQASQRGGFLLREFLKEKVGDWVFESRSDPGKSLAGTMERSNTEMSKMSRKEMLRRRKELQMAALADMQRQQAQFAQFIDSSDTDNDPEHRKKQEQPCASLKEECIVDETARDLKRSVDPVDDKISNAGARLIKSARVEKECVLCHDDSNDDGKNFLGLIGFHQKTRVPAVAKEQCEVPNGISRAATLPFLKSFRGSCIEKGRGAGSTESRKLGGSFILNEQILYGGVEVGESVHLFFCGHGIHIHCFERYFRSLLHARGTRHVFEGYNVVDLEKHEFLCPVCRRLSNIVFPLMTSNYFNDSTRTSQVTMHTGASLPFANWLQRSNDYFDGLSDFNLDETGRVSATNASKVSLRNESKAGFHRAQSRSAMASKLSLISRGSALLNRFTLWSSSDAPVTTGPTIDGARPGFLWHDSYAKLLFAATTTAACSEIAARSFGWNDKPSYSSRKSLVIVLREVRALVNMEAEVHHEAVRLLWAESQSSNASDLDPFVTFSFLFLLWPEPFTVEDARNLVQLGLALICRSCLPDNDPTSQVQLTNKILLYIRRCSILVSSHFETLAEPPIATCNDTGKSHGAILEEMTSLFDYLGIPKPHQLAGQTQKASKVLKVESPLSTFRLKRISLLKLPRLYQTLLEELDGRNCSCCPQRRLSPQVLCLVCGNLLCVSSRGCDVGQPRKHADKCGRGIGIFLSLNFISVNVVREGRSSNWGSPYLDAHGEEDENLKRGKPLFLNQLRYSALEHMWLSHSFDQDPRILSQTILTL